MAYELRDLSDIVQRVVDELKLDDNNARELERIRRDINDIYRNEVIPYHRWTWLTGHTDVEHKPYYGSGTVSVTPDSTTIEFSVAPSTSKAGFYFATDSFNEVYTIDSHEAGETTATLTTVYTGSLNDEATFKVWTDRVTLPTDLRETTEVWHDFSRFPMEGVGLQELRRKIADGGRTTQRPAYYSTTEYYGEDEDDRYRVLRIYPALYENSTTLHIDYVKEADSLELEGDEPIMPLEDRIVLVYGALSRAWRRARNPEEAATAQALFDRKLDRMKGKVEDSQDKPQLIASSTYLAGKRRRAQRSTGSPSMGGSSYSSPSYVKQATIEGGTVTANMSVNSGVTIDGRDISADGAELDNHIDATVGAHSASAISTDAIAGLSSDTVQGNLAELANMAQGFVTEQTLQDEVDAIDAAIDAIEADVATRALDSDLTAHIDDTTDAHDASAVSVVPVGNLAATDAQSALVELQDDIDTRIPLSQKGAANGVAELDASGLIVSSQIPALALVDVNVVADTTERDALTVQEGDLAFVTSEGKSYVYNGSGWTLLNTDTAVNTHNALTTGVHGVTGNVVGTTDAQVLSNKDIDGGTASNTNRITLPKNTKTNLDGLTRKEGTLVYATDQAKAYVDNGSALIPVGSGSGGGINYLSANYNAETDTSIWEVYKNTAAVAPTTGAGAGASVTWTRSTVDKIRDDAAFLLTKPASNCQGEGVSFLYTHPGFVEMNQISFEYKIVSGTYADGDVRIYAVSPGDGYVYEPTNVEVPLVGMVTPHRATFQMLPNHTSMRFCIHVASTSTSAYSIAFDTFELGPQRTFTGAIQTDPTTYTPTFNSGFTVGTGGNAYQRFDWYRDGKYMVISGGIRLGSTGFSMGTGTFSFTIPGGHAMDTSNIAMVDGYPTVGSARIGDYSANDAKYVPVVINNSSTTTLWVASGVLFGVVASTTPWTWAADDFISIPEIRVPIQGWSSGVTYSADAGDGRVISWSGTTAQTITTTNSQLAITAVNDTAGMQSGNSVIIQSPGVYDITFRIGGAMSGIGETYLSLRKGATVLKNSYVGFNTGDALSRGIDASASGVNLVAGDVITFWGQTTANTYGIPNGTYTDLAVKKRQGPAAIAAGETVAATYSYTGTQSFPHATSTIMAPTVKDFDSHGAYSTSTGEYTCPINGLWEISAMTNLTGATTDAGVLILEMGNVTAGVIRRTHRSLITSSTHGANGVFYVRGLAGQKLVAKLYHDNGAARTNEASTGWVSFRKVGEYV